MAQNLSEQITEQLQSEGYSPVWLFDFNDSQGNTYKYCDLDVPLFTDDIDGPSGMYNPLGFTLSSIKYSLSNVLDKAEVILNNVDSTFTSIFLDNGVHEQDSNIYISLLSPSGGIIDSILVFTGRINSFTLDEKQIKLTISSIFARWAEKSYAKYSASCRWKVFKGTECQYAGSETTCDRSYLRCLELGNTANFGGFRFLPDLKRKTLWWGPHRQEE